MIRDAMRPVALTLCIYSGLVWGYVCLRILSINDQGVWAASFIDGIPVTFWEMGIGAFLVSAASFWYVVRR